VPFDREWKEPVQSREGTPETPVDVYTFHLAKRVQGLTPDGRYPHWVAPYCEDCERYSLIFYQTKGEVAAKGPPIFGDLL
jgi:hypothetical protein